MENKNLNKLSLKEIERLLSGDLEDILNNQTKMKEIPIQDLKEAGINIGNVKTIGDLLKSDKKDEVVEFLANSAKNEAIDDLIEETKFYYNRLIDGIMNIKRKEVYSNADELESGLNMIGGTLIGIEKINKRKIVLDAPNLFRLEIVNKLEADVEIKSIVASTMACLTALEICKSNIANQVLVKTYEEKTVPALKALKEKVEDSLEYLKELKTKSVTDKEAFGSHPCEGCNDECCEKKQNLDEELDSLKL